MKERYTFEDLKKIMSELRQKCPWDRKQTHESLKKYLIEEAYEVLDAIDRKDWEALKEELGDLLLQPVFHAKLAQERGFFDIDDVVDHLCKKLIERHPHVFGQEEAKSAEEVLKNWEKRKAEKRKRTSGLLNTSVGAYGRTSKRFREDFCSKMRTSNFTRS